MLQVVVFAFLLVEVVGFMSLLEIRAMIPFTPILVIFLGRCLGKIPYPYLLLIG